MVRMAVATVVVAMSLGLAACGAQSSTSGLNLPEYRGASAPAADERTAEEVLAASAAALEAAESVTVTGTTTSGAETLTTAMAFSGDAGSGLFSHGLGTFELLLVDGQAWWKGDRAAYSQFDYDIDVVTRKIAGRWIVAGSSHPRLAPVDVYTTREEFLADFVDPGPGGLTRTPAKRIDGTDVIGLVHDTGTLYVATDTMLPVRLTLAGDDGDGIGFSYDDVQEPVAPPADQIVNLADLR